MWFWRKAPDGHAIDTVRDWLSEDEWQQALQEVRRRPMDLTGRERRDAARFDAITRCLLRVERRGSVLGMLLVRSRNLSSTGMCVIHGGRVPRRCVATVVIQGADGRGVITSGRTIWCKRVPGEKPVAHEIGIAFDAAIDVSAFVPSENADAA